MFVNLYLTVVNWFTKRLILILSNNQNNNNNNNNKILCRPYSSVYYLSGLYLDPWCTMSGLCFVVCLVWNLSESYLDSVWLPWLHLHAFDTFCQSGWLKFAQTPRQNWTCGYYHWNVQVCQQNQFQMILSFYQFSIMMFVFLVGINRLP